jgi:hypothetical protein
MNLTGKLQQQKPVSRANAPITPEIPAGTCASTNADPMACVTSAQNATSSVFFDTTHLPEAGHLFKLGLADAAWPLSAAIAQ